MCVFWSLHCTAPSLGTHTHTHSPVVDFWRCDSRTGRVFLQPALLAMANKASHWFQRVGWASRRATFRGGAAPYAGGLKLRALIFDPPFLGLSARSIRRRMKSSHIQKPVSEFPFAKWRVGPRGLVMCEQRRSVWTNSLGCVRCYIKTPECIRATHPLPPHAVGKTANLIELGSESLLAHCSMSFPPSIPSHSGQGSPCLSPRTKTVPLLLLISWWLLYVKSHNLDDTSCFRLSRGVCSILT